MIIVLCILLFDDAGIFETEKSRDFEIILKELDDLKNNPIEINAAGLDDLVRIPYLSINEGLRIIEYRQRNGPFKRCEDLLLVPGIDDILFERIRPFITIQSKDLGIKKLTVRFRGATDIPQDHNSVGYYTRSQLVLDQYNIFFVTEKDPYEISFFDYHAAGILYDDGSRRFVMGRYDLDFGSGLVLSPIGSFFQDWDFRMMVNERGIIPYTSSRENSGFFGAAFSDSLFLKYALFYSNLKVDGRIDSNGFARGFYESGLHADSLGRDRENRITEEILGYDLEYCFPDLLLSTRLYKCIYDPPFVCQDSSVDFYGDRFWIASAGIKYSAAQFILFTEWARADKDRPAGLFGFSGFFPYLDFSLAGKYLPDGFYSPKGAEDDIAYTGGTVDVNHRSRLINLGLNIALEQKPDEDSTRYALRLNLEKRIGLINASFKLRWRFTEELRELSDFKGFLRFAPWPVMFIDLRFEEKDLYRQAESERGIFTAAEIGVDLKKVQTRIRYGFFETGSYDSRIYAYEIDLPGVVTNRLLYGRGQYGFIYFVLRPLKGFGLAVKYSVVDRNGEKDRHLGCQLDIRR